jgi:pantoate--beta-alanine ligase
MILFKRAADLKHWLDEQRSFGRPIGFVPTMGALHAGHISLIDISRNSTSCTVCSIFINPTQFNDPKDFQKYPITIENDIYLLEKAGVDALFLPCVEEVYPRGIEGLETYDLGRLERVFEGKYRPGHFQGVCQVMRRLLDLVRPDHLFMGQKDYQQCMVVRRLLELCGTGEQLHPCPIVREPDGLAMSSRNIRLTEDQRKKATAIYQSLSLVKQQWAEAREAGEGLSPEERTALLARALSVLEAHDFRVDYVEVALADSLEPLPDGEVTGNVKNPEKVIALAAAFLGEIRLIDNMIL